MSQDTIVATPKYKIECRKSLFFDNFADGVADQSDWSTSGGSWSVGSQIQLDGATGYVYQQTSTAASYIASMKTLGSTWSDFYIHTNLNIRTASGSIGLVFRKSGSNYYVFKITQGTSNNLRIEDQAGTLIGSAASATISQNTWYAARVRISGTSIACDISTDGENWTEKITVTDSTYSGGLGGLKTYSTSAWFDDAQAYVLEKQITESINQEMISVTITDATDTQASTFTLELQNVNGTNTSLFQPGWEVHVWAGYAENSPDLNKLFVGQIATAVPSLSDSSGDRLIVTGTDLTTELLSNPVTEVYYNKEVGAIVKDLIAKYSEFVTAGLNVANTGYTVDRISFAHKSLFDCIKELALLGDGANQYEFWIDLKKDLHFQLKGATSSGKTLSVGTNILAHDFAPSLVNVYSTIRVFGIGKPDTNNVVQQTTNDTTRAFGKSTTYQKLAQTFILNRPQLFDVILKPTTSTGSPTVDLVVEIQETSSGLPTGNVLGSKIIRNADWLQAITDGVDITAGFDPIDFTPTNTYAIVVRTKDDVLSDTNYYNTRENSAGGYASGQRLYYDGSSWQGTGGGVDLYFKIYPRLPNAIELTNDSNVINYNLHKTFEDTEKFADLRTADSLMDRANLVYQEKTIPPYEGTVTTFGLDDVRASEAITVILPNALISGEYNIKEITHSISKQGYTSTLVLATKFEKVSDIIADHEARLRALEGSLVQTDDSKTQLQGLTDTVEIESDPSTNLTMKDYTANTTNTWFFGDASTCKFTGTTPKFGGGSAGPSGNKIEDASN